MTHWSLVIAGYVRDVISETVERLPGGRIRPLPVGKPRKNKRVKRGKKSVSS